MSTGAEQAELAIEGRETADHTVPADVLLRALEHLQRLVHLLAAAQEGRPINERFALPEDFRKRHELRCGAPRASSFAVPLSLATSGPLLAAPSPLHLTLEVMLAASRGAWSELGRSVPDPRYIARVLAELQAMLPRPGDRWSVGFRVGTARVALDSETYRAVREYTSPEPVEDTVMTVTGDLVKVDIEGRRIILRYRPTGREIRCDCEESALASVLEHWSEPIQVTGRFSLNRNGDPIRLSGVTRVEPVDLSPMVFDLLEWSGRRLQIDPPLRLDPSLDEESGQFYRLFDEELGVAQ